MTAARERRVSLGARHGPAPHSRKDEQRRRATAARAVTATSAQKADVLSGCGAVLSDAESTRGDVTGVAMARKSRARSARGKGRRRSREKASGLERARGRAHDGDEVDDGATILQLASGLRSRSASQDEGEGSRYRSGLRARGALVRAYGGSRRRASGWRVGRRRREAARPTATRSATE